jgi:hypothetical protein
VSDTQYVTCYRGEALTLTVTMDPAEDLTGRLLVFTLTDGTGAVKVTKRTSDGNILIATDTATVTLLSADTDREAPGQYPWDLWDADAGAEASLAHGALVILPRQRA